MSSAPRTDKFYDMIANREVPGYSNELVQPAPNMMRLW